MAAANPLEPLPEREGQPITEVLRLATGQNAPVRHSVAAVRAGRLHGRDEAPNRRRTTRSIGRGTIRAFIFPGQGSQSVGMGEGLADASPHARAVFQEVDEALGQHLSRLMWEGPEDELTLTANAQPAIMAVGMACLRVLENEAGVRLADKAAYVAGHSLGEYTALCAAGSLGLADTVRLLRLRGQAMQAAVPPGVGAMAALLGLDFETVQAIAVEASQGQVCAAANDNATGFSHQTGLPARTAALIRAGCVPVGVQIITASTSSAAMAAMMSLVWRGALTMAAPRAAMSALVSATTCTVTPEMVLRLVRCIWPMRPAPKNATRNVCIPLPFGLLSAGTDVG